MDSALDFGSSGCGFESHQGRVHVLFASVAQRIAHRTSNPGVVGSNPIGGAFFECVRCGSAFFFCKRKKQKSAPARDRTEDLSVNSRTLCQLSHGGRAC